MKKEVILMVGNVGSGKTTWIKQYLQNKNEIQLTTFVVSKDDIRKMLSGGGYVFDELLEPAIDTWDKHMISTLLNLGKNVIVDETNMTVGRRFEIIQWVRNHVEEEVCVKAVVMHPISKADSIRRKSKPETCYGATPDIWEMVWQRFDDEFVTPTESEGFAEIVNVGVKN